MMQNQANILICIRDSAATDDCISSLLCRARECAEIYLLVAKRQRGCDGMGELAMVKEEFREAVNDLINSCKDKEYLANDLLQYDLDTIADVLIATQ